jgi:hypothetical protein
MSVSWFGIVVIMLLWALFLRKAFGSILTKCISFTIVPDLGFANQQYIIQSPGQLQSNFSFLLFFIVHRARIKDNSTFKYIQSSCYIK